MTDYFMIFLIHGSIFYLVICCIFYPRMIYYYDPNEAYYRLGNFLYEKDKIGENEKMKKWKNFSVKVEKKVYFEIYT